LYCLISLLQEKMLKILSNVARVSARWNNASYTSMRSLYTDRFLGLNLVRDAKVEALTKLKEKQNLMNLQKRIIASANSGVVLSSDLESIGTMVRLDAGIDESKSDLKQYKDILNKFISLNKESKISLVNAVPHIIKFYQLCHLLGAPEIALDLFNDETVKETFPMNCNVESYLLLMNLLFKSEKYWDVLSVFEQMDLDKLERTNETNSILTLTLLALVKLDQTDSLSKATMLMKPFMDVESQGQFLGIGKGRLSNIYAWLAYKDGDYLTAYEIVQAHRKESSIGINIKLLTLLKMGKVIDTIFLLENNIIDLVGTDTLSHQKPKLCREVIQLMVHAVKESEDKEVISRLTDVFSKLDFVAEVVDESIEDLLCVPITFGPVQPKKKGEIHTLRKKHKQSKKIKQQSGSS